jgi:hypothetical protein
MPNRTEGVSTVARMIRTAGLVGLLMLVYGCGDTGGGEVIRPGGAPVRPAVVTGDDGEPTAEGLVFLLWAERELTGRCMVDAGFTYTVDRPGVRDVTVRPNDYGSEDIEVARREGYGLGVADSRTPPAGTPESTAVDGSAPDEQAAYSQALLGTQAAMVRVDVPGIGSVGLNRDGCTFRARRQLFGPDERQWLGLAFLVRNMNALVYRRVEADPRYRAALAKWRDCLGGKGYHYEKPAKASKAMSKLYGKPGTDRAEARATEIRTAVADIECRHATGLVRLARQLDQEHQALVRTERATEMAAYRSLQADAVHRATALL